MTDNQQLPVNPQPEEQPGEEQQTPNAFNQFVDHQRRAFEEAGRAVDALLPEGFKEHSQKARSEFLNGFRVLVDAAVENLEKSSQELDRAFRRNAPDAAASAPEDDRPPSTGRTKVKVQVD
ncbi:MAG: hypothetical protein GYB67_11330 [Chloroflexi bacterium]|nr:hypothetical protein [Chloroflexota bacterium]